MSAALVQDVKLAVARKRPFVRYGHGEMAGTYDANEPDEPGNGGCAILVQRDGTGPIIAAAMLKFAPGS